TARLRRRLRAVQGPEDDTTIHSARIAAKQVRYQLDAVAAVTPGAKACVTRLKALQDVLGDHHDAHLWTGAVREAIVSAPRAVRDGLEAVAVRAEQRGAERFSTLKADWLTVEETPALFTALDELADALTARGREGMEVERKYLLHRLPPKMPRGIVHRIEQGYVPGERIVERVRRVHTGRRVLHFRTMKAGRGVARIEVEEACSPALFAALWALTRGRRVLKRRHDVRDGELIWSIDELTDREKGLVLAEVELPATETDVAIPAWLARHIVREVTDDPAFSNVALAR
ncbi:MAG: CHAD domain-containing protein, partial [Gemmatimonadaceae bacterium]